jgi:tRNA pseudouridine32 synthase/23S rRNA pseudouridine746 synthase/23S rRNA pseudouridine1911/1915/1917 synthase
MRLRIIHEDRDILVVDKPAGLLTSTVPREKRPTLLKMVREYVAQREPRARVGLIHRLDRDASGLLIFSKNHQAYVSLKQQFFKHKVERIYLAVVHGVPTPPAGTIDTRLVERADGTVYSTRNPTTGERAVTEYETIERRKNKGQSLLRVRLLTGKKHQIRVQLSERGVPIVNDPVYGKQKPTGPLMLVAAELTIEHPRTGDRLTFKTLLELDRAL